MTKKLSLILLTLALLFTSCGTRRNVEQDPATFDEGVVINGIRWATRNVDAPGTFAQNPEDAGMLFQWNRRKGWNAVDRYVEGWDYSMPEGTKWYAENDPCPEGWRVPTEEEFMSLIRVGNEWTTLYGVYGLFFGTAPTQIFLPASGWRNRLDGSLYNVGASGYYWSSTQSGSDGAMSLRFSGGLVGVRGFLRQVGFSIRCVSIE